GPGAQRGRATRASRRGFDSLDAGRSGHCRDGRVAGPGEQDVGARPRHSPATSVPLPGATGAGDHRLLLRVHGALGSLGGGGDRGAAHRVGLRVRAGAFGALRESSVVSPESAVTMTRFWT